MTTVVLLGTCDTKLDELLFLRNRILHTDGLQVTLIDVGRTPQTNDAIDVVQSDLISRYGGNEKKDPSKLPRGEVIKYMATCATACVKDIFNSGSIHGIISAGGSGGTSLASAVMRDALPIGFPKFIVSTVASGDTGPIVEETDISLMYSVVDIAGLNQFLKTVLSNAGAAIAGMALNYADTLKRPEKSSDKKRIGITMFGVTTPAVNVIRRHLESHYQVEIYVFHATGHGGRAMERLVAEGGLDAVLDLTTTEICDFLTDGNMSAGAHRLEAAAKSGIPNVISLGAMDMSNYGPKSSVPERYKKRLLYEHNPMVTLMRTSKEECKQIAEFMAEKLKTFAKDKNMVIVWIPKGGVSTISIPGGPFADANADQVLFQTVREGLNDTGIKVIEDERAINDEGFAVEIAESLVKLMGLGKK